MKKVFTRFLHSLPIIHWYIYSSRYIHITHLDTPVQAYIYMLIQSVIDTYTYLALKIHLVFAFFAVYSGIDSYTLIHIFKSIHTHYTQRYASTSIYLYADTVSHWYIYLALKIHLVFAFFAVYSGIDFYTLIHIFEPIHAHYTQRHASTSIYLYADTVIR